MKTFSAKPHEVKREWFVIDAEDKVLAEADAIAAGQASARSGQGDFIPVPKVLARLKAAAYGVRPAPARTLFGGGAKRAGVAMQRKGDKIRLEFSSNIPVADLRKALDAFIAQEFAE